MKRKFTAFDWLMWAAFAYAVLCLLGLPLPGSDGWKCTPEAEARGGGMCVSSKS